METVQLVGIIIILWMFVMYFSITRQADRIEEKIDKLLKEQEGTINELQNAYGFLQKQYFDAQDKLLKDWTKGEGR